MRGYGYVEKNVLNHSTSQLPLTIDGKGQGMKVTTISNPRKPNGDFGDVCCDVCGSYSGAYVSLQTSVFHRPYEAHKTVVCKGCLINWEGLINKTILDDAVQKGRLTKYGK